MDTTYDLYYYIDKQLNLEKFSTYKEAKLYIQNNIKANGYHYTLYRNRNDGKSEIVLESWCGNIT